MWIEFVNHASVIVHVGGVQLMSDPWIDGPVFNNSWNLLTETRFTYEDFQRITHLWFSHEHPDHFSPPNLRQIPAAHRAGITVLYKTTRDKKVVNFCRQLGFQQVIELPARRWFELAPDVWLLCYPIDDDSALAIRAAGRTVLNTNDCVIDSERLAVPLKEQVGSLDVLLTQFSYANYVGETVAERKSHAQRKYVEMQLQSDVFAPTHVIPFASYVWFCHAENFHMNDSVNRIDDVVRSFVDRGGPQPVVLYPSDVWEVGQPHDSAKAITRYLADYERIARTPTIQSASVDLATLKQLAGGFVQRADRLSFVGLLRLLRVVKPLTIWLSDQGRAVSLGLEGLRDVALAAPGQADISMSSEVLAFCLRFDYGFNTTNVSGRFSFKSGSAPRKWGRFMSIGDAMNHGRTDIPALVRAVGRRALRLVQREQ
jgi:hypothetical protein